MLKIELVEYKPQHGTTLLEVLVTIVILTFGLLGLAGLMSKIQLAEFESYQRGQAIFLLSDMNERINANRSSAASYVTVGTLGTGDAQPASCTAVAAGPARDLCEWSNSLKGASEKQSATNVGAIVGARGCITQVQAPVPTPGVCTPGIYLVAIAWQGMHLTKAPSIACAPGLYGGFRRVIASRIVVGLPGC